jgi:hypothetical protein
MSTPRFRLRTLLIAVAVVGVVLGAGMMRRRRSILHEKAAHHRAIGRRQAAKVRGIEELARAATTAREAAETRADARVEARIGEYHAALARKYQRAAARPWLPVAPDPPPPD